MERTGHHDVGGNCAESRQQRQHIVSPICAHVAAEVTDTAAALQRHAPGMHLHRQALLGSQQSSTTPISTRMVWQMYHALFKTLIVKCQYGTMRTGNSHPAFLGDLLHEIGVVGGRVTAQLVPLYMLEPLAEEALHGHHRLLSRVQYHQRACQHICSLELTGTIVGVCPRPHGRLKAASSTHWRTNMQHVQAHCSVAHASTHMGACTAPA